MSALYNFLLLNTMYLAVCVVADELCPKACSVCFNDHLSCTTGGLRNFPQMIHETTTKITLIGHMFESSILSKSNFSRFAKPRYSIEQLSIRQSNVDTILSNTFVDLSGLDTLDLSDNRKMTIELMAFANLKLKHLKLDQIHVLTLSHGAFDGLMVASLSMKNSRLKVLPFDLLEPISKKLRNLFLSHNHLRYLEPKFELLFRSLQRLDLTSNPFQCTCDLRWLSHVTLDRIQREYSDFYSNYPSCVGPPHVRNRLIHNISDAEFSCTLPSLEMVDVRFPDRNSARLQCSARMSLKSIPLQIVWQQLSHTDTINYPELEIDNLNEAVANVKRSSATNHYRCLAISNSGNVSVKISITWPPMRNDSDKIDDPKLADSWLNKQLKSSDKHFFFREQFTLLEMLGAVMGTFTVTLTVFILLYRFCFRMAGKTKPGSTKKSGYSIYEAAVYNDSQTYDVPQHGYGIQSHSFVNRTLPNNGASHYIDYLTQQRISHN